MKIKPLAISMLFALALIPPAPLRATSTVGAGSNLLQTDPTVTTFFGHHFEGVPLNTFDFGGAVGVQDVGTTDIIIRRLASIAVAPGSSATVPTVVDAFQLRSVEQISIMGGPVGIYYITLASERGGPESTGTMTIHMGPEGDPHGTFSSSFNLFVDVRLNSLDGTILRSQAIDIPDSGSNPWRHAPTGPIQIDGVNTKLNGLNSDLDFWIIGSVSKQTPNGVIGAGNAGTFVPDLGSTLPLLGMVVAGMGWIQRRLR
jgi:hypothetical protein